MSSANSPASAQGSASRLAPLPSRLQHLRTPTPRPVPPRQNPSIKSCNNEVQSASSASKIKELSPDVRKRIAVEQVVMSLAGACRELIDNALDAGATLIGKSLLGWGDLS